MLTAFAIALVVQSADTRVAATEARLAALDRQRSAQRAELAAAQTPLVRLLAAIERLALRPATLAFAQPRSLDEMVHAHALFAALRPTISARAAALRQEMAHTSALGAAAAQTLATIGTEPSERERALGERLLRLPAPPAAPPAAAAGFYRLPASGTVISGTGERIQPGGRARGLTLLTAAGAPVIAPGPGRVAYAGPFGGYGDIVILDHGRGWTTVLTGLGHADVRSGAMVDRGSALGQMGVRARRLTIELRRNGEAIDVAGMTTQ